MDKHCPTCSCLMIAIGCKVTSDTFYWCGKCGTIHPCSTEEATVPLLAQRIRESVTLSAQFLDISNP